MNNCFSLKSLIAFYFLMCIVITANAQKKHSKKEIERVIISLNGAYVKTDYGSLRIPFSVNYTEAYNNFVYPAYTFHEEVLVSWQLSSSNTYLKAHYIFPEDAPILSIETQKERTDPNYFNKNFLQFISGTGFGHGNQLYKLVEVKLFKDSNYIENQIFLLINLPEGQWKIFTRPEEEDLKEMILFYSSIKDEIIKELGQSKYEKLKIKDSVFLEAYKASRAFSNNRFVISKFIELIKKWRSEGELNKINFFYRSDLKFHGFYFD